ncbi:MAG TPA: transcriptional repressor AgaR [Oleiagrimonas sp.]|nr:transcriptional repressor AgaR [Oleiagrimonas sp.]
MNKPPKAGSKVPRMLLEERRRHIVEMVEVDGRATVDELARHFDISAVTIRGDLDALARAGAITRSHGGALPAAVARTDTPLPVKETRHLAEKRRIGAAAAKLIGDGETIILDSGSTTVEIARQIRQRRWLALTVITNALNIAMELNGLQGVRVMMLGGMLRPTSYSLTGTDAEQALSKLTADRLFLGVDGLDPRVGATTPDPQEATLNAQMVHAARESIAVLDSSKLGRRSLSVIIPVTELDVVITDTNASGEALDMLREQGVRVMSV